MFAGTHTLNGNGEMTGLEWVRESGHLTTPIGITNTHSVGVVRDALVSFETAARDARSSYWALPVAAETYDGALNDINGMHVRTEHVHAAIEAAVDGPVPEGAVGGGTGMICHEFKGGTGTASRVVEAGCTVGALVQANHGDREHLMVDGVPVGRELPRTAIPSAWDEEEAIARAGAGSIIVVLATDAPLLPHQLDRLAQRAGLGIARAGGAGSHSSGDIFLAFSTGNADAPAQLQARRTEPGRRGHDAPRRRDHRAVLGRDRGHRGGDPQRDGRRPTLTGRDGITAHALPHDELVAIMTKYGRGPA